MNQYSILQCAGLLIAAKFMVSYLVSHTTRYVARVAQREDFRELRVAPALHTNFSLLARYIVSGTADETSWREYSSGVALSVKYLHNLLPPIQGLFINEVPLQTRLSL